MAASCGFNGNYGKALWTFLRDGGRRRTFRKLVKLLDHNKDYKGDDYEIDEALEEAPIGQDRGLGCNGLLDTVIVYVVEGNEKLLQIHFARNQADQRHDHIANQRRNNLPEGCADHHTDGQIDHIPAHREFLEFLQEILAGVQMFSKVLFQLFGPLNSLFFKISHMIENLGVCNLTCKSGARIPRVLISCQPVLSCPKQNCRCPARWYPRR